jgi:hypothetical protein
VQLPTRGDDFRTLELPTPERWRELQRELQRAEQIAFLVQRLRLLRCQQMSIPGGISYAQRQVATVPDAAPLPFDPRRREEERINPFLELLQLNLKAGELPALLPALESRDYVLAFDLERFLPQGPSSLHRVAWVAATVCNEVAQEGIVDPRRFLGDPAERDAARAELVAWCHRHADRTAADRLAERIAETDDWQETRRAFWNLQTFDPVRAATTMRDVGRARPAHMPEIVRLFALLDRREFVGEAREWLRADDADQRFFAAVLLLRGRQETAAALDTVRGRLEADGGAELAPAVVEALLACELPAATTLLRELLAGTHASGYRPTAAVAQRLLRAGWPEAHAALRDALAGKRRLALPYGEDADATAEQARAALVHAVAAWWPDATAELDPWDAANAPAAAVRLQELLDADWQRIQTGSPPTMAAAEIELPWGGLLSYSTGWIRRM